MKIILGALFFLSLPVVGMQSLVPARAVYDAEKTHELKALLNKHILAHPLPHVQIKQLVLDGADPNVRADESHYKGYSWFEALLLYSHISEHFWATTHFLHQQGANPNLHPRGLLASACHSFSFDRIPQLLRWGANIHSKDEKGQTPLFNAINGHIALMKYSASILLERELLVELLLQKGAIVDVENPNDEGITPLVLAQNNELTGMLELFQMYKIDQPQMGDSK